MDNEQISLVVAMLINEVCKHSSNATDAANAASVLGGIYDSAIYNAKSFGAGDLKTTMDIVAASLPVAMKAISNELLSGELAEPIRMFREDNITRFNEEVISAYQTGLTLPPTIENVCSRPKKKDRQFPKWISRTSRTTPSRMTKPQPESKCSGFIKPCGA
mgnify:CR=1 FL=1